MRSLLYLIARILGDIEAAQKGAARKADRPPRFGPCYGAVAAEAI